MRRLGTANIFPMILTPIAPPRLKDALDQFAERLASDAAREAFALIRATSPERAKSAAAERDRLAALNFAQQHGLEVHAPGTPCAFNWDGTALDGATEAYVILHEVAHYLLAPPARRVLPDFGLGPGPDTRDRAGAERAAALPVLERETDEAMASLLGILWEAKLGQPALASFLDQNWLEGLERTAAAHFSAVLQQLVTGGYWTRSHSTRIQLKVGAD
jgi:hypothetical protein